jgi:hypothetical protein
MCGPHYNRQKGPVFEYDSKGKYPLGCSLITIVITHRASGPSRLVFPHDTAYMEMFPLPEEPTILLESVGNCAYTLGKSERT